MTTTDATGGRPAGEAGFTLIDLLFVCGLVGLLSTLAVPGLTRARGAAQASSALAGLRVINSAELSYAISCGAGFYAPDLPTLGIAPPGSPAAFLSADLSSAPTVNKSGFQFRLAGTSLAGAPPSCNGLAAGLGAPGYKAVADPLEPSVTRFFGTNSSGLLYEDTASLWAAMPESGPLPGGRLVQ
ncbi:MAG TPA: type II secretion system protein [Vicinamibacterales bacterium]|jgi:type II secretory pathway pseudopilin PulG|nr:type II secretion system protein [Vicinamibacterales bacterium]